MPQDLTSYNCCWFGAKWMCQERMNSQCSFHFSEPVISMDKYALFLRNLGTWSCQLSFLLSLPLYCLRIGVWENRGKFPRECFHSAFALVLFSWSQNWRACSNPPCSVPSAQLCNIKRLITRLGITETKNGKVLAASYSAQILVSPICLYCFKWRKCHAI